MEAKKEVGASVGVRCVVEGIGTRSDGVGVMRMGEMAQNSTSRSVRRWLSVGRCRGLDEVSCQSLAGHGRRLGELNPMRRFNTHGTGRWSR